MANWVENYLTKAFTKIAVENKRLAGATPYIPYDGHYSDVVAERGIDWWSNGFWAGLLWQSYHYTHKNHFYQSALLQEKRLDKALHAFKDIHHDVGFLWLLTAVAHYRVTGDEQAYRTGLHAANLLAGRFNIAGNFLVSWNDHPGWCIIDSMMNIQLLFWASDQTRDPRFAKIALRHADTIAHYLVRSDDSVGHIASFDPQTGEFIGQLAGQGVSPSSAWARGQAWAIYGFALTYRHTKQDKYLAVAQRVASYFITESQLTADIPLADFRAPVIPKLHDTSAGMIAACGLLEIADSVPYTEKLLYKQAAVRLIQAAATHYADWGLDEDGIVGGGTEAYHRPATYEVPLIYTDYFFVEALLRLREQALFVW